jgi:anti-anti-sigma regulatory factor
MVATQARLTVTPATPRGRKSLPSPAPRLTVAGELDLFTTATLVNGVGSALQTRGRGQYVLDCTEVRVCTYDGLRALVSIQERAERGGLDLILVPGRGVQRALDLFGVTERFHLTQE